MPSFLLNPLLRWGAVALVVAGLVVAWQLERAWRETSDAKNATYEHQLDDAVQINRGKDLVIHNLGEERDQAFLAIGARDRLVFQVTADLNAIQLEASRVARDPVCPVDGLMLVFDRLRQRRTPPPDNPNGDRAGPDSGAVARVP